MVVMTANEDDRIYSIPLEVRTKYNFKKEYDGTDCESVISLFINESYGFLNNDGSVSKDKSFEPVSLPYMFSIAIDGKDDVYVITGRDLKELHHVLECLTLSSAYQGITKNVIKGRLYYPVIRQIKEGIMGRTPETQPHYNLRVYGHNLQFQTLRNLYEKNFATEITRTGKIIKNVFSRSPRTFMTAKAVNVCGYCDIQFFDTSCLVKKSLKEWVKDESLPINIMNIDINDIKTPTTKLTDDEINACKNNALCIMYGMRKFKYKYKTLASIPLTSTGIVRDELESIVCEHEDWSEEEKHGEHEQAYGSRWSRLCSRVNRNMTPEDYARLRQIFTGGICFTSRYDIGRLLSDIDAYDIRSAYTSVMCHFKFPVTEFEKVPSNQWNKYLNENDIVSLDRKEAWYGHFIFKGLKSKGNVAYWPFYKYRPKHTDEDNIHVFDGRMSSCSGNFEVYLTDIDFIMFKKFYDFESVETIDIWRAKTELLPEKLIKVLLEWFGLKSQLPKESRQREEVKIKLNATYGIFVTRLYDDDTIFLDGWRTYHLDGKLFKDKHDRISSLKTIGSYQIGVWVAAWERFVLGSLINNETAVYGDTDSLFGKFSDEEFDRYHRFLQKRRRDICKIYTSLSQDMFGKLGYIEKENHFEEFKTIGQKRYSGSYYEDGELKIKNTVAGLPKTNTNVHIKTPSDLNNRLIYTKEESGLLSTIYNDSQPNCKWTDRDGKTYTSKIKFGAIVTPTPFMMSNEITSFNNIVEFLGTDMYCVNNAPDPTDALYIKESLDD